MQVHERILPNDPRTGVICAFRLGSGEEVGGTLEQSIRDHQPLWIHANIGNAGFVPWISSTGALPPEVVEILMEREIRHRLEVHADGFLLVTNDFVFEEGNDPGEVAPVWIWVGRDLMLTVRLHALRTTDSLRVAARSGAVPACSVTLFLDMLERQIAVIERISRKVGGELDHVEDQILIERILSGREQIGRLRRLSTSLRRHFRPLHLHLHKLSNRPPVWFGDQHVRSLRSLLDDLAYLVEESSHQLDSAKLLQEELTARDAEATGRNLYVLTVYTAAFLPMTLISGIFGMNLSGMPWSGSNTGFWWVLSMILASGLSVLFVSFRRFF